MDDVRMAVRSGVLPGRGPHLGEHRQPRIPQPGGLDDRRGVLLVGRATVVEGAMGADVGNRVPATRANASSARSGRADRS